MVLHEFHFSLAHRGSSPIQKPGEYLDGNEYFDDEDDLGLGWDYNQDDLSNLIAIERVDSRDVVFDNRPKKTKILGKYVMGDVLGEGSYAKVKEVLHTQTLVGIIRWKRDETPKIPEVSLPKHPKLGVSTICPHPMRTQLTKCSTSENCLFPL